MVHENIINESISELYVDEGFYLTENYPTKLRHFYKRKILAEEETKALFKEITELEKDLLESSFEEYPDTVFIDLWNSACGLYGKYNPNTGYFELNGLTDITYRQAIEIYTSYHKGSDLEEALSKFPVRTNMPVRAQWNCNLMRYALYNTTVEVLNLPMVLCLNNNQQAFYGCTNLLKVYGIHHLNGTIDISTFYNCKKLKHLEISKLKSDLHLEQSSLLSLTSLQYLIENAGNTTAITIFIHPDVYTELTEELIVSAASKNISFVS